MKYRKKPVVVEAIQYKGVYTIEVQGFLDGATHKFDPGAGIRIATLEGVMLAEPFDWIIKGTAGEFYPVKPNIFEEIYEEV